MRHRERLVACFLIVAMSAFAASTSGQNSTPLKPHRGPSSEALPGTSARENPAASGPAALGSLASVDSVIGAYMSTQHIPGLAACIIKGNRVAWQGYYGYANLERNLPVTANTMFMLASISKTIMVTALMQLYEQGRFTLEDSINAYLPFPVRNPTYPGIPITFKMLLTHTSSIRDNWFILDALYAPGDPTIPLGNFLGRYLTPGGPYYNAQNNFFTNRPGTFWDYSNIGAALAGYLVEVISGVPFDQYCKDHIFTPLQMTNTAWFLRDLDTSLVAHPYEFPSGSYVDQGLYGYPDYPDGSLRTTVPSLARFLLAHMNGGAYEGTRILDSSSVRMMRTVYVPTVSHAPDAQWGLIWYTRSAINGSVLWGHSGGDAGVMTAMFFSGSDSIGVIMLTNGPYGLDWKAGVRFLMSVADTLAVDTLASAVDGAVAEMPGQYQLLQNYPNPFNPTTVLRYEVPVAGDVRLAVFDMLGREVAVLVNERKTPGSYSVIFDASGLSSGVYFCRLRGYDVVQSRRMMLVR
jgi:CubicO group peptidase (beta-lactamase class C family)